MPSLTSTRMKFGIVGGLGAIGGADLLLKIIKSTPADGDHEQLDISFEQSPFDDSAAIADEHYNPGHRKFHVYNTLLDMEQRGCKAALVPCFVSHSFLDEIAPEVSLTILSILEAIRDNLRRDHPSVRRVGVLTSSYVRKTGVFDRALGQMYDVIYPDQDVQSAAVMPAVYGPEGIKAGRLSGRSVDMVAMACENLIQRGAELVILGSTELPILMDALKQRLDIPILDANQAYADFAVAYRDAPATRPFKLGVVGGVGPAATVDFMDKVVKGTTAARDQDHIKMVVEQNPQIPDRTANLISDGDDPTIALYSTCKRLVAEGADAIAIPCNTAHAYVARIQKHLGVPIVNMLTETVAHIRETHPEVRNVGLLATNGTVQSGVYQEFIDEAGLTLIVPDAPSQELLMTAIYGELGVKAGITDGQCRDDLRAAIGHLGDKGAEVVILGCTELPLIAPEAGTRDGLPVLLDPTGILARKCVSLAQEHSEAAADPVQHPTPLGLNRN